ncbi:type II toxin-antitoxin system VapC family toxin [Mesorhizobium sp. YR577]|uniref:type II toxin-antitoxin system VapC family toxin n=1 Tax=Mesorhizobium sp. YR577 TaxID=1884373 RepID=UPI000B1073DC|nr:type II toxin-antitoxin system VapC family toxin [Mesorhizobium sp. YR577]
MIVDASALLAIIFDEPDGERMENMLIESQQRPVMSPVNFLEATVRVDQMKSEAKSRKLDELFKALAIEITTVTPEQAYLAREAYQKFGKGNHPAKLNLGDCFAYALAKARNEPLLFKGDDFRNTDIEAAI